jgi:small subunit ribosomal protein S5
MAREEKREREPRKRDVESGELMEKVLYINRCSKTVKGGKKMSFSALILVGDGKGHVGYGFAKANELTDAIRKGGEIARKNMQTIVMEGTSIPHDILVKWDGAQLFMRPAPVGTGVIAGSKVRAILEFAGIKDVMAKSIGSSNPINQVRATFKALLSLKSRQQLIEEREAV